jgi:hypothetical protein
MDGMRRVEKSFAGMGRGIKEARQKQIKYEISFPAAGFFIIFGYMGGIFSY